MELHIGFFDSGVGGLAYFDSFKKKLDSYKKDNKKNNKLDTNNITEIQIHYLADNEFFPYGEKSSEQLITRLSKIIPLYIEQTKLDILVIACNTASLIALDTLRKIVSIPIIGIVPALKPALEKSYNKIYVMTTEASSKSTQTKELTKKLIDETKSNSRVFIRACQDLVSAVELMLSNEDPAYHAYVVAELSKIINEIRELDCQAVVLGCTHFLHIKSILLSLLTKDTVLIDSIEGVINRIFVILEKVFIDKNLFVNNNTSIQGLSYCSSSKLVQNFVKISTNFGLNFNRVLVFD